MLINAHVTNSKVMPFLHLPIQSGSDRILKKMNRRHTSDYYIKIIEKLKSKRPDIALSSDFIVVPSFSQHPNYVIWQQVSSLDVFGVELSEQHPKLLTWQHKSSSEVL